MTSKTKIEFPNPAAAFSENGIARVYAQAPVQMYSAAARGVLDFWGSALARGAPPAEVLADAMHWWAAAVGRARPTWSTPHRVIAEWPSARLRDFTPDAQTGEPGDGRAGVVPTLLLPPQAGHDSCIVDFAPGQSQIQTILDAGLTRVASLDWIGATGDTRNATIQDHLDVIGRAIDMLGGPVNLIGDCQGGWLAVIYAALHPEQVHTLTVAGAPIDTKAGDPQLQQWLGMLAPTQHPAWYAQQVAHSGGVWPGRYQVAGFKAMQPAGEFSRLAELFGQAHDGQALSRYAKFADWFENGQDLAGPFYLWTIEHLFIRNELAAGLLRIGRSRVDLTRIRCPLYLIAGAGDHITPAEQVWALEREVGTDPAEITRRLVPAGHLGLFMGRAALREHWRPMLADIRSHSAIPREAASEKLAA